MDGKSLLDDLFHLASDFSDRESLESEYTRLISSSENSGTSLEEFVLSKIADNEESYFLFTKLNIAIRILEEPNQQRIPRARFVRFAPALGMADPFIAPKVFEHLDADAKGYISVNTFTDFLNKFQKVFQPDIKWKELREQLKLDEGEILLKHSSYVTYNTDDSIGPSGSLYLTPNYIYFESPALQKQKLIPLRLVASVNKKRTGFIRNENMIEICGGENLPSLIFTFHRGRDRWFEYIKDLCEVQQMEKDVVTEALKGFICHNIRLSRALYETTGKFLPSLSTNSSNQAPYRKFLLEGIANTSLTRLLRVYMKIYPTMLLKSRESPINEESYKPFYYLELVNEMNTTMAYLSPLIDLYYSAADVVSWQNLSTSILAILISLFLVLADVFSYGFYIVFLANFVLVFWHPIQSTIKQLEGDTHRPQHEENHLGVPQRNLGVAPSDEYGQAGNASIFAMLMFIQKTTLSINRFAGKLKSLYRWDNPSKTRDFLLISTLSLILLKQLPAPLLGSILVICISLASSIFSPDSVMYPWAQYLLAHWSSVPVAPPL